MTGGAGYLGIAICETLGELGATVIVAGRNVDNCRVACANLEKKLGVTNRFVPLQLDVTQDQSVQKLFSEIKEKYGALDILVNNAWSGKKNSFETISEQDWQYDIDISLNSVFRCVKTALPLLKESKGVVLNVTSMYGHVAPDHRIYDGNKFTNPPSYGAAKAGVIQFTKYLASFLSPYQIRVNCISPGPFPHEQTQANQQFIEKLCSKNPLNRIGYPEDMKGAVALLCSQASNYMTGQNICVDGGWTIW